MCLSRLFVWIVALSFTSGCSFCETPLTCVADENCPAPQRCVDERCAIAPPPPDEGEGEEGEGEGEPAEEEGDGGVPDVPDATSCDTLAQTGGTAGLQQLTRGLTVFCHFEHGRGYALVLSDDGSTEPFVADDDDAWELPTPTAPAPTALPLGDGRFTGWGELDVAVVLVGVETPDGLVTLELPVPADLAGQPLPNIFALIATESEAFRALELPIAERDAFAAIGLGGIVDDEALCVSGVFGGRDRGGNTRLRLGVEIDAEACPPPAPSSSPSAWVGVGGDCNDEAAFEPAVDATSGACDNDAGVIAADPRQGYVFVR